MFLPFRSMWLLLFPRACASCGQKLCDNESSICTECRLDIPLTYDWINTFNQMRESVGSEYPIEWASALFIYQSEVNYSDIVRKFKFSNQFNLAQEFGEWFGTILVREGVDLPQFDAIVPLPLHPRRWLWRGYNQSYFIAKGLSTKLSRPLLRGVLMRVKYTKPQSHQTSRGGRLVNIEGAFAVRNGEKFENKHILLVDDVCTTGFTLKESIKTIKKAVPSCKISVATLARTHLVVF